MFHDLNNLTTWISLGTFIITALGGFFIVQTFMLQARTMLDQQEQLNLQRRLSAIEHERYRVQFRPVFELVFVNNIDTVRGDFTQSVVHYKLKLISNDSRNFNIVGYNTVSVLESFGLTVSYSGAQLPFSDFYQGEEYDLRFVLKSRTDLYSGEGGVLRFIMSYEDTLGNAYRHEHNIEVKGPTINSFIKPVERVDPAQ